jgi:8-oxo-dGTP pyrophosphatase MutT (NUDIX family)
VLRPVLRLGYRVAYIVLSVTWTVVGRAPTGVKCVILRGDDVLLVRHTYGPRRWELPGGTKRPREAPEQTARRETREEIGADIADWTEIEPLATKLRRARLNLHAFVARVEQLEPETDGVEIAQARFFPVAALPKPIGPDVKRILDRGLAAA